MSCCSASGAVGAGLSTVAAAVAVTVIVGVGVAVACFVSSTDLPFWCWVSGLSLGVDPSLCCEVREEKYDPNAFHFMRQEVGGTAVIAAPFSPDFPPADVVSFSLCSAFSSKS